MCTKSYLFIGWIKHLRQNQGVESQQAIDENAWPKHLFQVISSPSAAQTYTDRKNRCLGQRVGEQVPNSVNRMPRPSPKQKTNMGNLASSIAKHFMTFGHQTDSGPAFQVILRNPNRKLLAFCETLLINKCKIDPNVKSSISIRSETIPVRYQPCHSERLSDISHTPIQEGIKNPEILLRLMIISITTMLWELRNRRTRMGGMDQPFRTGTYLLQKAFGRQWTDFCL